jgi:hypothetical protein
METNCRLCWLLLASQSKITWRISCHSKTSRWDKASSAFRWANRSLQSLEATEFTRGKLRMHYGVFVNVASNMVCLPPHQSKSVSLGGFGVAAGKASFPTEAFPVI